MSEPMSKERLADIQGIFDFAAERDVHAVEIGLAADLFAEVHRLRERERVLIEEKKKLHEALRALAFNGTTVCQIPECYYAAVLAPEPNPEGHAPGCLAAPLKD
jgi:hypothetical protein